MSSQAVGRSTLCYTKKKAPAAHPALVKKPKRRVQRTKCLDENGLFGEMACRVMEFSRLGRGEA